MSSITRKKLICALFALCIGVVVTGGVARGKALERKMEQTQEGLAEEVFRFHVLANSDSDADQELKMVVRDGVIAYMKAQLPKDADKEETIRWAKNHITEITQAAEEIIQSEGFTYPVEVKVETETFPEKHYGDITFPAGEYEALRVLIGEANGHNWWCVLYPNLCFVDSVHAVVPEEGKAELEEVLTEEEYEMVTMGTKFQIKWFFFGD